MRKIINTEQIHIKLWLDEIEDGALEQAKNLANHPLTFHHIALMPDCHVGYGMPIGGVIACNDGVIPNAVGVDIGCGMCAVQTSLKEITEDQIKEVFGILRNTVPVGFNHHKDDQQWIGFNDVPKNPAIINQQIAPGKKQLGTLGGGNHFIEIQKGDNGYIWLMLHSGSRNVGYKIAKYYNNIAQRLCERWHSVICPFKGQDGLAFLPKGTPEFREYLIAMKFALDFALENRHRILLQFQTAIVKIMGSCDFKTPINIHHNFAAIEHHFGRDVWIHRKGATMARTGQIGIIPGSMGTASYIVRGLGNKDSFQSCSHGAGRLMGRAEFSRTHTVEECNKAMEGVIFGRWGKSRNGEYDLSEAPQAYKNIDTVIENQKDLVEVVTKLKPLGVMKG